MKRAVDKPRVTATKKNIRAVCARIAEGHTIVSKKDRQQLEALLTRFLAALSMEGAS